MLRCVRQAEGRVPPRCWVPAYEWGPKGKALLFLALRRLHMRVVALRSSVLTTSDHARDRAGLRYVYPVYSRRSAGLSVGINLNPNNACNWRCVYCQVEGLTRGAAPAVDLNQLRQELESFLREVVQGDYLQRHLPPEARVFRDIAFSGNGEPTTAREFVECIRVVAGVRQGLGIGPEVKTVLITNGSQMHRKSVQSGLEELAQLSGEVWFKLDRATAAGLWQVNGTRLSPARVEANLEIAAVRCPTWIQTCVFAWRGTPPPEEEIQAYLQFLARQQEKRLPLKGVLLYSLARPSAQPEARDLAALPQSWLEELAGRIAALGLAVRVSA